MINGKIRTPFIEGIVSKRKRIDELKTKIDVIKIELQELKEELESKETEALQAILSGKEVSSKIYQLAIKEHWKQAYINWQKKFGTEFPERYSEIKEEAGKELKLELVIARREVA